MKLKMGLRTRLVILLTIACGSVFCEGEQDAENATAPELCLTEGCITAAANVIAHMDWSVDPCDDFYGLICGRWSDVRYKQDFQSYSSWFTEQTKIYRRRYIRFLEQKSGDDEKPRIVQARTLYKSCNNWEWMYVNGVNRMLELMDEVGLNLFGHQTGNGHTLMGTASKVKSNLNLDLFASVRRLPDGRVLVRPPKRHFLQQGTSAAVRGSMNANDFKIAVGDLIGPMCRNIPTCLPPQIRVAAEKIYTLWNALEIDMESSKRETEGVTVEEMSIEKMQSTVDRVTNAKSKIQWGEYLKSLWKELCKEEGGVNCSAEKIESSVSNATYVLYNTDYFQNLSKYLDSVNKSDVELWMWMKIMYTVGHHVNSLVDELLHAVEVVLGQRSKSPRDFTCAELVASSFPEIEYYRAQSIPGTDQRRHKVQDILWRIQRMQRDIMSSFWMDEDTQQKAVDRLNNLYEIVAYPDPIDDPESTFVRYLENLSVPLNDTTHTDNVIRLLQKAALQSSPADSYTYDSKRHNEMVVSTEYVRSTNGLSVPESVMSSPFYYDNGLDVINYALLGSMLGHEIVHALEPWGESADGNGGTEVWWDRESFDRYTSKAKCYADQIDGYVLPSINKTLTSDRWLDDVIADAGGLDMAYTTFASYREEVGLDDMSLPGLENFNIAQLFFVGYAAGMCDQCGRQCQEEAASGAGDHLPGAARVNIPLRNSHRFSEAFECAQGTTMNPEHKCQLFLD